MSGPKTGGLSLEQLIEREIQAERDRNLSLANNAVNRIGHISRALMEKCRKTGRYQEAWTSKAREVEGRFTQEARLMSTQGYPSTPKAARLFNDELRHKLDIIVERCQAECASVEAGADREIAGLKALADIESFAASVPEVAGSFDYFESSLLLAKARGTEKASLAKEVETLSRLAIIDEAERCFDEAQNLLCDEGTTAPHRAIVVQYAAGLQEAVRRLGDDDRSYEELKNAISSMNPVLRELARRAQAMRDVYEECLTERARIEGMGGNVEALRSLSSYQDEDELESVKARLVNQGSVAVRNAYIADAIDAVMEKHGYRVKKSVRFSESSPRAHCIYLQDGGEVAVHSFVSGSAVMMETGFAEQDFGAVENGACVVRSTPRSAYDRARSVEEQGRFCRLFDSLGDDLAELGVRLEKTSDKPISEDNAVLFASAEGGKRTDNLAHESKKRSRQRETLAEREAR